MRVSDFETLFTHSYWARDKILEAASELPPDQLTAPANLSQETILGVLKHTFEIECSFRWTLQYFSPQETVHLEEAFEIEAFEDLPAIWREEEANMFAYLAGLADQDLDEEFSFPENKVEGFPTYLWHHLMQVVYHSTHHRSEVTTKLRELGNSPGNLDFIAFLYAQAST